MPFKMVTYKAAGMSGAAAAFGGLCCAVALLFATSTANAALIDVSYGGRVDAVTDPASAGVMVGDSIEVSFRYDTADLVDVSNAPGIVLYQTPSFPGLKVATLSGPRNFLNIRIGGVALNAQSDYAFGNDGGVTGFPGFPLAAFVNGKLIGVEFDGFFNDDLDLVMSPIARITAPDQITADVIGLDFRTGGFTFTGSIDVDNAQFSAAPEPASWAMLLLGFAGVGGIMRSRGRQPASASPG